MRRASPDPPNIQGKLIIGVLYGFRAIMVLLVCHYHIWQQSWLPQYYMIWGRELQLDFLARAGYMFVDGMLLMSGFLLYLPYARKKAEGIPAPGWKEFGLKRAARILPSYLSAVLLALLLIAIPQNKYATTELMVWDIANHLTFSFNFFKETCLHTPLNGALWTVAVEVQFYLVFPLLAIWTQKKPALTLGLLSLAGMAYRGLVYAYAEDTSLLVNQMPAFLDVYALGMLGAILYLRLVKRMDSAKERKSVTPLLWAAIPVFILSLCGIVALLREQASSSGYESIRRSQLALRLPFAICILGAMLSAAIAPRFIQKVLDNRFLRFFSTISFNLYIWHQLLSVQIRQAFFPDTFRADRPMQVAYTLLCFSCSILAAMLATFGVELPCARFIHTLRTNRRNQTHERSKVIET